MKWLSLAKILFVKMKAGWQRKEKATTTRQYPSMIVKEGVHTPELHGKGARLRTITDESVRA
jgi:hypothetical protein